MPFPQDGQTLFAEGFGYRDMEKKLPFENSTRTNIGSLTKAFTATPGGGRREQGTTEVGPASPGYPGERLPVAGRLPDTTGIHA